MSLAIERPAGDGGNETEHTMTIEQAQKFATAINGSAVTARVWQSGAKVRVYLTVPAKSPFGRGASRAEEIGWVDFSGAAPVKEIDWKCVSQAFRDALKLALV